MTFRFIEEHIGLHENGGTGSLILEKITSLYFYRGRRLSQKLNSVGAFDVSEPEFFLLNIS